MKCNCNKVPFQPDPPCFKICAGKILAQLNVDQLISFLGIDDEVASRITSLPNRSEVASLDAFDPVLGNDMEHVVERFRSLSKDNHAALRQHLNL